MKRWLVLCVGSLLAAPLVAGDVAALLAEARAAEARFDSARALELFRQANAARPDDPHILQQIARQYSDLVVDQQSVEAKRACAQAALDYARRAAALAPRDPVNVLSLAICYGKLAVYSDTRTKVRYSRLVKEHGEQALALDPGYAWAHHVLGRWHYEVAGLGGMARFFANLFYGGVPPASFEQGVAHLQRATELEPDELNHWIDLGFAYRAAGRMEEARAAWARGLAMPDRGKHDAAAKLRARNAME